MQSEKPGLLMLLLSAYIISAGFTAVITLPVVGQKIQVPELIFVPIFITWGFSFRKNLLVLLKPGRLEWSILFYLMAVFISALFLGTTKAYLEVIGIVYLILVFYIFKTSLSALKPYEDFILQGFTICGVIAAMFGIAGWLLLQFGIQTTLVKVEPYFPYFGEIGRAVGLTATPNMLHNILGICFLIFLSHFIAINQRKTSDYVILAIFLTGLILTFAKTILLLIIAVLFIWYQNVAKNKASKMAAYSVSFVLFIICMTGTHLLFIKKSDSDWSQRKDHAYFKHEALTAIGNYNVLPTNYAVLKATAVNAGLENFFTGVGPGGHNEYLQKLKSEGRYPHYFENFDPHCIYTGVFGELGIIGLLALCWMMYEIARQVMSIQKSNSYLVKGLMACFIFFALEGFVLDILNFRHLWVLFGLMAFASATHQKTSN